MFDKNPSANANNFGANSNSSVPTPPPIPPRPTNNQIMEGQGVEDIFSSVSSGEGRNPDGNPMAPDNSIERGGSRLSGEGMAQGGSMDSRGMSKEKDRVKNKKGGKKVLVLFIAVIVVAAAGAGAWYYMDNFMARDEIIEKDNTANENTGEASGVNSGPSVDTKNSPEINVPDENIDINADKNVDAATQIDVTKDSDSDGLTDEEEGVLRTNPYLADSDRDGLTDWEEINIYGTDPLNPDTDGDGYNDGTEVKSGYNPSGPGVLGEIPEAIIN